MKRRNVLLGALLLLFLLTWMWWGGSNKPHGGQPLGPSEEAVQQGGPNQLAGNQNESNPQNPQTPDLGVRRIQSERSLADADSDWRAPINFYGMVVDENGEPIAEAQIVLGWNNLNGSLRKQTTSDIHGRFSLEQQEGKYLAVYVTKSGYYSSKSNSVGFFYAGRNENFSPDARNPVLFHLRRMGMGEPVLTFSKSFRVPKDGTPVVIDLLNPAIVSLTETGIEIECWTEQPEKRGGQFNWKCSLTIPGGGLQANTNEFGFEAPVNGYVDHDEIDMTLATASRWQMDVERNYFIRTASGRYGRLTFRMIAHGDHFCVVESVLNPSGSRNLEPAPTAQPKQTQFE